MKKDASRKFAINYISLNLALIKVRINEVKSSMKKPGNDKEERKRNSAGFM